MSTNDPEKLFKDMPKQASLTLNAKDHIRHGLCWFADKDESFPDAESVWRNTFEASEEEIIFSDDRTNTRKTLAEYNLFGIPFKYVCRDGGVENGGGPSLGIGLGKKLPCDNLLYAISLSPNGLLALGRIKADKLPPLIEDCILFYSAMQSFWAHPSRLASGLGDICFADREPSDNEGALGPWNFVFIPGGSLNELKAKTDQLLNEIGSPKRLWAVYLRAEEPILRAAAFSLVEADGIPLEEPVLQFDVSVDVTPNLRNTPSPMRMAVFWQ